MKSGNYRLQGLSSAVRPQQFHALDVLLGMGGKDCAPPSISNSHIEDNNRVVVAPVPADYFLGCGGVKIRGHQLAMLVFSSQKFSLSR
jgi:hypothetical protein